MHETSVLATRSRAPGLCKILVPLVAVVLSSAGCDGLAGPSDGERAGVGISHTAFELAAGESALLKATSLSAPASTHTFTWSSSNPGVVEVDGQGRVTGKGPGVAHIRVQLDGQMDSATVRVGAAQGGSPAWLSVHAGDLFTCALDSTGQRYCWGSNPFGAHGSGVRRLYTATHSPVPAGDPLRYRTLSAGNAHACGITVDGVGYCWGNNAGNSSDYELRPNRLGIPRALAEISSGLTHACALDVQGSRYCWGSNLGAALGIPSAGIRQATPLRAEEDVRFVSISAGLGQSCGVTAAGEAFCWGTGAAGELGDGAVGQVRPRPHPVSGGLRFASISAGNAATCALTTEGAAYCWGVVTFTEGGAPRRGGSAVPYRLETDVRFAQVSVGAGHACGRTAAGAVYCWGLNEFAQAGVEPAAGQMCASPYISGGTACVALPHPVSGGLRFRQISTGRMHTCGVTFENALYCWGRNEAGQLGSGRIQPYSAQPVRVAASF